MADIAFLRVYAWFDQAITEALKDVAHPNRKTASREILRSLTDPGNPDVASPPADPAKASVSGMSLSVAPLVSRHFNDTRAACGRSRLRVGWKKRVGRGEASSALRSNIAVQSGLS